MAKSIYLKCFQTGKGVSAAQITKSRYRRLAGMDKQSMLTAYGFEVWFSWARFIPEKDAYRAASDYGNQWFKNGRPSLTESRKAIEEGRSYELFD